MKPGNNHKRVNSIGSGV